MKKIQLLFFASFIVCNSFQAQYAIDQTYGNANGYTYCEGLNPAGTTNIENDECKKLIPTTDGSGNIYAVGTIRFFGDPDDLDIGFFQLSPVGNEIDNYQYGTSEDEHLQDALLISTRIYFCGYTEFTTGEISAFIGYFDLLNQTTTLEYLPISTEATLNSLTTDGTYLYFCGDILDSGDYKGFVMKTDLNLNNENGFGFGGYSYVEFNSAPGNEYFYSIIYSQHANALYVAGSEYSSSFYKGGLLKLNTSNGSLISSFTRVNQEIAGLHVQFNKVKESPIDHSLIVVGSAQPFGVGNGIIGRYSENGAPINQPAPLFCDQLNDVFVTNDRVIAVGEKGDYQFIYSLILSSFTPDSDFNVLENSNNFYTDEINSFGFTLTGNAVIFFNNKIYVGGILNNYWIPGNTTIAVSKYFSNGADVAEITPDIVQVAPNPFSDKITLNTLHATSQLSYEIVDENGRIVQKDSFNAATTNDFTINTATIETGMYLLNVSLDGYTITKKIIKN